MSQSINEQIETLRRELHSDMRPTRDGDGRQTEEGRQALADRMAIKAKIRALRAQLVEPVKSDRSVDEIDAERMLVDRQRTALSARLRELAREREYVLAKAKVAEMSPEMRQALLEAAAEK